MRFIKKKRFSVDAKPTTSLAEPIMAAGDTFKIINKGIVFILLKQNVDGTRTNVEWW